jgi:RNA-directed DNA polymerase
MQYYKVEQLCHAFLSIKNVSTLAQLCKCDATQLTLVALHPKYKQYYVPKAKGGMRLIEDPEKGLKKVQSALNDYLQAWYYMVRPACAHGFSIATGKDDVPRGIKSNATVHVQAAYLLNIDLLDFFHQVTAHVLSKTCAVYLPKIKKEIQQKIIQLCCYKDRLPMGAPTSPVLSNLACLDMDEALMSLCRNAGITYTRYADDLSFSAAQPIDAAMQVIICDTIMQQGFSINYNKVKYYGPADEKIVTGLVLHPDGVHLPSTYVPALLKEIERLKIINDVDYRYNTGMSRKKLNLMEQEIQGKIRFVGDILGGTAVDTELVENAYANAIKKPEDFESLDWLELPYEFI